MSDPAESDPSQSSETSIESQELRPRVLISVALEQEQILRTEDWIDWLKSFPALAHWIHLESAYVSDSNLLLISLPVVLWDMLPKHPAISFISFVRSRNLLANYLPAGHQSTGSNKLKLSDTLIADTAQKKNLFYPAEMPSQRQIFKNELRRSDIFKTKQAKGKMSSESLATTLLNPSDDPIPSAARAFDPVAFYRRILSRRPIVAAEGVSRPQTGRISNFPIEVHLPTGALATCIAHIDIVGDAHAISINLVESLELSKDEYKGDPLRMVNLPVQPRWQTTFDWHSARSDKTFTTTFFIFDKDPSQGPDIVLGMQSTGALAFLF